MDSATSHRERWARFSQTLPGDMIATAIPIAIMFAILGACALFIYMMAYVIGFTK